ncbi:MAT1-domain-containing protein, partial [Rhizoclosmatium globosum]
RCESCINRLFLAGAAPCPFCKTSLRKSNFVTQTFEDLRVEKEVHYRKKVGKFFNKRLEDFNYDQRKFDDYLEEVEDIMFNLINDVDVQATNERVEKFRQENKDLIAANLNRQANEDRAISNRLKREREEKRIRREALVLHEVQELRAKELEKQAMIDELASSDKPPEEIIQAYKKRHLLTSQSSKSASTLETIFREAEYNLAWEDDPDLILDVAEAEEFDAFDHEYVDPLEGFALATSGYMDPWTREVAADPAARAAGFLKEWSFLRAIQSSFYGVLEGVQGNQEDGEGNGGAVQTV